VARAGLVADAVYISDVLQPLATNFAPFLGLTYPETLIHGRKTLLEESNSKSFTWVIGPEDSSSTTLALLRVNPHFVWCRWTYFVTKRSPVQWPCQETTERASSLQRALRLCIFRIIGVAYQARSFSPLVSAPFAILSPWP